MLNLNPIVNLDDYKARLTSPDPAVVDSALCALLEITEGPKANGLRLDRVASLVVNILVERNLDPFSEDPWRVSRAPGLLLSRIGDNAVSALLAETLGSDNDRALAALLVLMNVQNEYVNGDVATSSVSQETRSEVLQTAKKLSTHPYDGIRDAAKAILD